VNAQRLIQLRAQKDAFFKNHPQSPLSTAQKENFSGLTYYVPQSKLDLVVEVNVFEKPQDVQIQTTTGEVRWYMRYGEFTFQVGNESARLTIYQTPHGFFLPFVDVSAGQETYPSGRYLEPEDLGDGFFRVDFNQAYNPYCAYAERYSCPITPAENRLKVAIQAGEKLPVGDWSEQ
jgi:uncharacterized protein